MSGPSQDDVETSEDLGTDRDTVLELIDWEIGTRRAERQQLGWTRWAIYGALAAVAWAFLHELGMQALSWKLIACFAATLWLLLDIFRVLGALLGTKIPPNRTMIYRTNVLARHRARDLVKACYSALMCVAVLRVLSFAWPYSKIAGLLAYGPRAVMLLSAVMASYGRLIVPYRGGASVRLGLVYSAALLTATMAGGPLSVFTPVFGGQNLYELRIACLIVAAMCLVYFMLESEAIAPLLSEYEDLRREVLLRRIRPESARKQMGIMTNGLRVADVLEADVSRVIQAIAGTSVALESLRATLRSVKAAAGRIAAQPSAVSAASEFASIEALAKGAARQTKDINAGLGGRLVEAMETFRTRAELWRAMAPDYSRDVEVLLADVARRRAELVTDSENLVRELERVASELGDLKKRLCGQPDAKCSN